MENKKDLNQSGFSLWNNTLRVTAGFLGGVIVLSGTLGLYDSYSDSALSFVTQGFLGSSYGSYGGSTYINNPNNNGNNGGFVNPTNTNNPNGTNPLNPNPANPVNPNNGTNVPNPSVPVNPLLLAKWNLLFQTVMWTNASFAGLPSCDVKASATVPKQYGSIHFEAVPSTSNAQMRCGLMDYDTNILSNLADINVLASDFGNLVTSKYKVICLIWNKNSSMLNANNFNYCESDIVAIN